MKENEGRLTIASVTWHELLYGCWRLSASKRREAIERYLIDVVRATIPILPYDTAAAQWHAGDRVRLSQLDKPPPFADGQIAAIAAVHGLTLVTANTVDFEAFDELTIENWLIP